MLGWGDLYPAGILPRMKVTPWHRQTPALYSIGSLAPAFLYFHLGCAAATHHTTGIPPCTRECIGVLAHVVSPAQGVGWSGGKGGCVGQEEEG